MQWFRFYSDGQHSKKVKRFARVVGCNFREALGAWCILLCMANESPVRGRLMLSETKCLTIDDIADELGLEPNTAQEWLNAMVACELIENEGQVVCISGWDEKQYESDSSAERTKRYRERQKASRHTDVTRCDGAKRHGDVTVTPPDTDTDTEADTEADTETTSLPARQVAKTKPTVEVVTGGVSRSALLTLYGKAQIGVKAELAAGFIDSWLEDGYTVAEIEQALRSAVSARSRIKCSVDRYVNGALQGIRREAQAVEKPVVDPMNPYNLEEGKGKWVQTPQGMVRLPADKIAEYMAGVAS